MLAWGCLISQSGSAFIVFCKKICAMKLAADGIGGIDFLNSKKSKKLTLEGKKRAFFLKKKITPNQRHFFSKMTCFCRGNLID